MQTTGKLIVRGDTAYLAKSECEKALLYELEGVKPAFALDIWRNIEILEFDSIKSAADLLKERARLWAYYGNVAYRRGALIGEYLRLLKPKPLQFGVLPKDTPFGVYTLQDEHHLLLSTAPWKKVPFGQMEFVENKTKPPNRAYLKLWEALTYLRRFPQPGEVCLDLGASPGGWSWVLAECGAKVIAVDKAPLAPHIASHPGIQFQAGSAFALHPKDFGPIDWLCSDIICYPQRLLSLIEQWQAEGQVKNMICTIKLQGEPDWPVIEAFKAMPGAEVIQLFHNKNELCFLATNRQALSRPCLMPMRGVAVAGKERFRSSR